MALNQQQHVETGEKGLHIPSVSLALPPVGWQRTLPHAAQSTTVCACEKTVVMAKHPWVSRVHMNIKNN